MFNIIIPKYDPAKDSVIVDYVTYHKDMTYKKLGITALTDDSILKGVEIETVRKGGGFFTIPNPNYR